jgi:hypothetical protein
MFIDELSEDQVMAVAPIMLPELLAIAAGADRAPDLRARGVGIFRSIIDVMEIVARERKQEVQQLLGATLGPWLQLFAGILATPTTQQDAACWGLKLACLSCLVKVVPGFGKWAAPHLPAVMAAAWQMFGACLPLYLEVEVHQNTDDEPQGM